jgi:CRISPR type III-A-associated RAMP protein Csm4
MNPGLVVKLRPAGPWRIGPDSGARNRVDAIYHSDSLYSAVTSAMSRMGSLSAWLDATARNQTPAVCFSSCFPFLDDIGFVVPPRTIWPPTSPAAMSARVRWKSARFIPLSVVESILSGKKLNDNQWSVDGASGCLVPAGKPGPFRTSVRWNAAVDRLSGSSERHATACIEFREGCGLWTVAGFHDEAARDQWQEPVKAAFRLLADTGFGGERSRGWGRSETPEFVEGTLPGLIVEYKRKEAAIVAVAAVMEPVPEIEPVAEPAPEAGAVAGPETDLSAELASALEAAAAETKPDEPAPEVEAAAPETEPAAAIAPEAAAPEADAVAVAEPETEVAAPETEPAAEAAPEAEVAAELLPKELAGESACPTTTQQAGDQRGTGAFVCQPASDDPGSDESVPEAEPTAAPAPETELSEEATGQEACPTAAVRAPDRTEPMRVAPAPPAVRLQAHWLLSLFAPAPGDAVDWGRGSYAVLARGGRIDSPSGSGELKKQIQMVAEGSVLFSDGVPLGAAPDVAPDGFAHPVFRAGFALAIPLPEVH